MRAGKDTVQWKLEIWEACKVEHLKETGGAGQARFEVEEELASHDAHHAIVKSRAAAKTATLNARELQHQRLVSAGVVERCEQAVSDAEAAFQKLSEKWTRSQVRTTLVILFSK